MSKKEKLVNELKKQQKKLSQNDAVKIANFLMVLAEVHISNSQKSNPKTK